MSNFGNKGKFSERIKNIAVRRKKKPDRDIEDSDILYKNFLKIMGAVPLLVYDNVLNTSNDKNSKDIDVNNIDYNKLKEFKGNNASVGSNVVKSNNLNTSKKIDINNDIKRKKISEIDVSLIKKEQDRYYFDIKKDSIFNNKETKNDKTVEVRDLEKKIINRIKKHLIKTVNELEILQSELYLIKEVNGDSKTLSECQDTLNEIKKILCKIDILKNKYDFLADNYDFEYMLEIDDDDLIDNIIELKEKFSNNEVRAVVADYKLLDVYKYLYLRIDKLQEQSIEMEEYKELELEKIKKRDIDFDKLKEDVYNTDRVNNEYELFVKNQNDYLSRLDEKISKIDSREIVNYKLKGFNTFLFNSFKYVGLLMLNPLKGIIPSIATETLITKNTVSNLYKNLEWEEHRKMVYEAIDYSSEISNAIGDLDYTNRIVDGTLEDIVNLKIRYNEYFKKYQGNFSEYENVIRKINDMENKILGNKIKIEIMKKRMLDKERENAKKLILVKKLNDEAV